MDLFVFAGHAGLVVLPLFLGLVAIATAIHRVETPKRRALLAREATALLRAGRTLGLVGAGAGQISGRIDGVDVRVGVLSDPHGNRRTEFILLGVPPQLLIRRVDLLLRPVGELLRPSLAVRTGDPSFDTAVHVSGDPFVVAMAMTSAARAAVHTVITRGFAVNIRDGYLQITDSPDSEPAADGIIATVRMAHRAVTALQEGVRRGSEGLVATVREDPALGVRVAAFRQLTERDPDTADRLAPELLQGGVAGGTGDVGFVAELRLLAACRVGAPALDVLHGLVRSDVGDSALEGAIQAVARLDGSKCEPFFLSKLGELSDAGHLAVVQALGEIGTVKSIAPLAAFAPASGALHRATLAATGEIRERMPAVEGGRLSLAETGGEMSLAGSEVEPTTAGS